MKTIVDQQRTFFNTGITKEYEFRKNQIKQINKMIQSYENEFYHALKSDLNKSEHEAFTTEIGILYAEIDFTLKHLKSWMADEQVPSPVTHTGAKSFIHKEPYGTVLVIAPWNYPVQLALLPVISAITAGNTVVLKPSELAPHTARLLSKLVNQYFDDAFFTVVEGGIDESNALLEERFDYIFFTGSPEVGKIIMEKASVHLTPVTLELGGKSPAIVDKDANIKLSAKRIVWGKYTNAGQTCVAPDYVYVHEKVYKVFLKQVKKEIIKLYGKNPLENENYVRIINKKHFNRIRGLLKEGSVSYGGEYDRLTLKIAPAIIENITWGDPIMKDEIFGPLLPVLAFSKLDEAIETIKDNEKPLALYYFGNQRKQIDRIIHEVSYGGGCVNDTLYHLANPHLPFGGIGNSGMGNYHGIFGFDTFTHRKAIVKQTTKFDFPFRYPGGKFALNVTKKLLGSKNK